MRLRDVSKTLYYTKKKPIDQKSNLKKEEGTIPSNWNKDTKDFPHSKYLFYLTIATFIFFLITIAIAYFVQFTGIDRTVSASKITIITQGPKVVDGGTTIPLTIRIANRNPVAIQEVTLSVQYPSGSYKKKEVTTELRNEFIILGNIGSGEIITTQIAPSIYGTEGEKKEIKYELEYRVTGTSQKTKTEGLHQILLRSAPVLVSKPTYSNPVAGKEFSYTVSVQSNTTERIPTAYIEITHPSGFTPTSFRPQPSNQEGTLWRITGLQPGKKQVIQVTGIIRGEEREEQAILARAYISPTEKIEQATKVAEESSVLSIGKSFLDIALSLNRSKTDPIVVSSGEMIEANIKWQNLDTERLQDLVIIASIRGTGLDESSISPRDGGYFEEVHRVIIWDKKQKKDFSLVDADESGIVTFSFNALPDRIEFPETQKQIQIHISAQAKREKTNSVETAQDIKVGTINLRSNVQVVGNTLYASSSLKNKGPIPPRVGVETSYVLKYFVKNNGNQLANISMRIPLAQGVNFLGTVDGLKASEWEYDEGTHTILVTIPTLDATGSRANRLFEIQVSVKPSDRDIGEKLTLAEKAEFTGEDTFVNEITQGSVRKLTTLINAEPIGGLKASRVVE